jgi:ankyrin repeat protein
VDARDRFSATALHAALRAGNLDLAARLARAGADPFARDREGDTPASLAMARGQEATTALAGAAGLGALDFLGNGFLHYAAFAGDAQAAALLLSLGADRGARNISGETASDVAAKRGKAELAAMLK